MASSSGLKRENPRELLLAVPFGELSKQPGYRNRTGKRMNDGARRHAI
jgi:hypothetical protein